LNPAGSADAAPPPKASLLRTWLPGLAVLLLVVAIPPFLLLRFVSTPGPAGAAPRTVEIPGGAGLRAIASALETGGVVSDARLFALYAALRGSGRRLRAGEYEFAPGTTPRDVLSVLERGATKRHVVTLPEGWTFAQMAQAFEKAGIAPADGLIALARDPAFLESLGVPGQTLEGWCFPDTYAFTKGTRPEAVWRTLAARARRVLAEERGKAPAGSDPGLEDAEVVTLASIVERETGRAAERPLIAAVFLNRLRRGIPLGSDPTVIYGISGFDGNLTRDDLERPGPYNTYLRSGLPPGPIANPGRDALRAVLAAPAVDYLYFVSRNDGSHQFSRTLEEHNRAVREFQLNGRHPPPSAPGAPPS
jgi:UPF0755 protein